MQMERVYTVEEAAAQFHVGHETIRRWMKTGKLKATKMGRRWLIPESSMHAVLKGSTKEKA
jgi:excisionase family DNA binding protein